MQEQGFGGSYLLIALVSASLFPISDISISVHLPFPICAEQVYYLVVDQTVTVCC